MTTARMIALATLTVIIGVGDWVTGIELPFTILYLLPIGLGAWFGSRRIGGVMSGLAAVSIALAVVIGSICIVPSRLPERDPQKLAAGRRAWKISAPRARGRALPGPADRRC